MVAAVQPVPVDKVMQTRRSSKVGTRSETVTPLASATPTTVVVSNQPAAWDCPPVWATVNAFAVPVGASFHDADPETFHCVFAVTVGDACPFPAAFISTRSVAVTRGLPGCGRFNNGAAPQPAK